MFPLINHKLVFPTMFFGPVPSHVTNYRTGNMGSLRGLGLKEIFLIVTVSRSAVRPPTYPPLQ